MATATARPFVAPPNKTVVRHVHFRGRFLGRARALVHARGRRPRQWAPPARLGNGPHTGRNAAASLSAAASMRWRQYVIQMMACPPADAADPQTGANISVADPCLTQLSLVKPARTRQAGLEARSGCLTYGSHTSTNTCNTCASAATKTQNGISKKHV